MVTPKRSIHFDFHTMPGIAEIGNRFDAETFAGTLADMKVDYINFFAKCNVGYTYYPSEVGVNYPGLSVDMLGGVVDACHKRGIGVSAYINSGLDHEQFIRHRDWCRINAQGQIFETDKLGDFFRMGCMFTPYRQYLLALVDEVLEKYPVDGLFLDCLLATPCYGSECIEGMQKLGIDTSDNEAVTEYARRGIYEFLDDVEAIVRRRGRDIRLFYNGVSYKRQPGWLEMEVLPTGGWGYDFLPTAIRYSRTLNKGYLLQTARFHKSWGDFGGIRPEHSLLNDCYTGIAHGAGVGIGDHLHPSGEITPQVARLVKSVFDKTSALDPWTENARAVTEIAVVEPGMHRFQEMFAPRKDAMTPSVRGASRMLSELKAQFDVCDSESDLSGYSLLVLPDHVEMDPLLEGKIQAHIAKGGAVLSSGWSCVDVSFGRFVFDAYKASYLGDEEFGTSFFSEDPSLSPLSIYDSGIKMTAGAGCEVLAQVHDAYFDLGKWDGIHRYAYSPPRLAPSDRAAAIRCGNVSHIAFPVFEGYFRHAPAHYKALVKQCLDLQLPQPLVRADGFPSFGQITVTAIKEGLVTHLLAYAPEQRGASAQVVEEPITVCDAKVAVRVDGRRVAKAYTAPDRREVEFSVNCGYIELSIPRMSGYAAVVLEWE